jgi:hypothetical protein
MRWLLTPSHDFSLIVLRQAEDMKISPFRDRHNKKKCYGHTPKRKKWSITLPLVTTHMRTTIIEIEENEVEYHCWSSSRELI